MSKITNTEFSMQVGFLASHAADWAAQALTLPEDREQPVSEFAMRRFLEEFRGRIDRIEKWYNEEPRVAAKSLDIPHP
jgi:hypothetical protein